MRVPDLNWPADLFSDEDVAPAVIPTTRRSRAGRGRAVPARAVVSPYVKTAGLIVCLVGLYVALLPLPV